LVRSGVATKTLHTTTQISPTTPVAKNEPRHEVAAISQLYGVAVDVIEGILRQT
jgi:hypothetical protein